ncbi:hypothetical protein [Paludisphaera rhizosphaerae]|uniref:hypothetical protein n=1 Tax=Paludisphaera rhizosphaerae TaxID=2711216 RepID=UPI0013E9D0CE|nr:hypothetical protein [Paludisphaera rhizosphaerae]
MPETDRRSSPSLWMLILFMLGLYTIPRGSSDAPPPGASKEESKPSDSGNRRDSDATEDLVGARTVDGLLLDYFSNGRRSVPRKPSEGPSQPRSLDEVLGEDVPAEGRSRIRCLIATLADPIHTTSDYHFDEALTAILRGIEASDYVLDRYLLPWQPGSSAKVPEPPTSGQSGLLVCRHALKPGDYPLLLVFLVPESPTSGLDKVALAESLKWSEALDDRQPCNPCASAPFNILGPAFSGSQASLEQALRVWIAQRPPDTPTPCFDVVSGSASAIDAGSLEKSVAPGRACLRYRTTVHGQNVVEVAMHRFLKGQSKAEGRVEVALLYESNTGFGQLYFDKTKPDKENANKPEGQGFVAHYYSFPQNIARIRSMYEGQEKSGGPAQFLPPSERLVPGSDVVKRPLDLIAPQTPKYTTPLDELIVDEILMDISHREIRTIGITATDVRDVIFLVGKIRRMIPDARIFTTDNDLVFTHPEHIADLRGMFVASTYPLLPRNQSWSTAPQLDNKDRSWDKRIFFSSNDAQGIYNASVLQLHNVLDVVATDAVFTRHLIEYGRPFQQARADEETPPVWIGVVGNHGIYPLHVDKAAPAQDAPIYPAPKPTGGNAEPASDGNDGAQLQPTFRRGWLFFFSGLCMVCVALAGLAIFQLGWDRSASRGVEAPVAANRLSLPRLAEWLNWIPARGSTRRGRLDGPRGYLLVALLFMIAVLHMAARPILRLRAIAVVPWAPGGWASRLIVVAVAVQILMAVGAAAALVVLCAAPRTGAGESPRPPVDSENSPRRGEGDRFARLLAAGFTALLILLVAAVVLYGGGRAVGVQPLDVGSQDEALSQTDDLLAFYRTNALSSGVSPVFPLLFLSLAWLGWVLTRLYSRYLQKQATPRSPMLERPVGALPPESCPNFGRFMSKPWRCLLERRPIALAMILAFDAYILAAPISQPFLQPALPSVDEPLFVWGLSILFALVLGSLTFEWLQLLLLWQEMRRCLHKIERLPFVGAFDRLPPRVARWVYEAPKPRGGRYEAVRRQAEALSSTSTDAIPVELCQAGVIVTAEEWSDMKARLLELDPSMRNAPLTRLCEILFRYRHEQTPVSRPDEPLEPEATKSVEKKGGSRRRNSRSSIQEHPGPDKALPQWIKASEDFLALVIIRWLAAWFSQIWLKIGYLVSGTLCAILAVSSYPFPWQARLITGLGWLALLIVTTIIFVVFGVNRDEVVSRVADTTPNRITVDQPLMANLFSYVVPLLGSLAFLSFDVSDVLRTWFDPLMR